MTGMVGGVAYAKQQATSAVPSELSVTQGLLNQIDSQLGVLHTEVTDLYRVFNMALREPQDEAGGLNGGTPVYDSPLLRRLSSQDDAIREIREVIADLKSRSVL